MPEPEANTPGDIHYFATTHWSVVLSAGRDGSPEASNALENLCRAYWHPIYHAVRRHGHGVEAAQDLTQDFFARLLAKEYLRLADPARGRFRTFLLSALKHFLINQWSKDRALKRGGGEVLAPLDAEAAEGGYLTLASGDLSPDAMYDQSWAQALVNKVLARLRSEYAEAGKQELFDALKGHLWGDSQTAYKELSDSLGLSDGALRVASHRLRERFRQLLREEVAHTVTSKDEVDGELRHLIAALRSSRA